MNIDRDYIILLYEIYKKLLNDKEKNYFEYYFYEDYSLNEISELYKVSKAYASKYLNKVINKLIKYESLLNINERNNKIRETIKNSEIKNKIEELL